MRFVKLMGCRNLSILLSCAAGTFWSTGANAIVSVADLSCNASINVTIAGTTRTSSVTETDCQERTLTSSAGFSVIATNPSDPDPVNDSSGMASAGGELYESYVAGAREAAVLLTKNRALMMSRAVSGDNRGLDWNLGLAVQPVTSGTNAWLTGTYTLLRANREVRTVDALNQTNEALSEVFDPVTLRVAFDGNGGCSVASYSSWFSYSLTTDPAGAFTQPDGDDYGLHQAVYAGEGYSGQGGLHEDATRTFSDCDYALASDGKLSMTYNYTDGDSVAHIVENAYYVSADLRYLVSAVNPASDLYRGFEVGVRVKTISGTQDERNDSVAGMYLFNAPNLSLQGATGVLSEPDNEHRNSEKVAQCMSRGAIQLSLTTSSTAGWNVCTWGMTNTCSVRGEEGEAPNIALSYYTGEGTSAAATCRYQVAANGSVSFVVSQPQVGVTEMTFSGAVADNNEAVVLKGMYLGPNITDPSDANPPERDIKDEIGLSALVAIKYEGTLTLDADSDGLNNLEEFLYSSFAGTVVKNDFDNDGDSDLLFQNSGDGSVTLWGLQNASKVSSSWLGNVTPALVKVISDVDGDADADVLFQNASTTVVTRWTMQAGAKSAASNIGYQTGYALTKSGDLDADGDSDLIFENGSGSVIVWLIENGNKVSGSWIGTWAGQSVVAIADVDMDGDDDIVTQDSSGNVNLIKMQNGAKVSASWVGGWSGYNVVGSGDADNDGDDDIYMETSAGSVLVIVMEGGVKQTGRWLGAWSGNAIKGVGDIDRDGDMDLIQQNTGNGSTQVVEIENANKVAGRWLGTFSYTVKGVVDADGDGDSDIAMQSGAGSVALVEIEAGNKLGGAKWLGSNTGSMKLFP